MEIIRSYKVLWSAPSLRSRNVSTRSTDVYGLSFQDCTEQDSISCSSGMHCTSGAAPVQHCVQRKEINGCDVSRFPALDGHLRCWNFLLAFIELKVGLLFCRFTTSVLYTSESGTNSPLTWKAFICLCLIFKRKLVHYSFALY
ncbi:hypothetical protein Zmor_013613 [Zophobas morio]|uniref:Uncharacterized protein n=1 Tax=Zophobas morio TaxID=2755281 RepID=A0AA38IFY9_9CUCU|nr:hypothetical protein Zmor_013613 [Zophobas morio]